MHAAYILTLEKLGDSKAKTWQETDTHIQNEKTRSEIFSNAEIWGENGAKANKLIPIHTYKFYSILSAIKEKLLVFET